MVPLFQIVGPSKNPYPGTICLPQVPLPQGNFSVKAGDNATIQVVETAIHGAALYSVCGPSLDVFSPYPLLTKYLSSVDLLWVFSRFSSLSARNQGLLLDLIEEDQEDQNPHIQLPPPLSPNPSKNPKTKR